MALDLTDVPPYNVNKSFALASMRPMPFGGGLVVDPDEQGPLLFS